MTTVREQWGMACPECGSDDLRVSAEITVSLVKDGSFEISEGAEPYFDGDDWCCCQGCDHDGYVKEFDLERQAGSAATPPATTSPGESR